MIINYYALNNTNYILIHINFFVFIYDYILYNKCFIYFNILKGVIQINNANKKFDKMITYADISRETLSYEVFISYY